MIAARWRELLQGGVVIDGYNQTLQHRIHPTLTTRYNSSNMYFLTDPNEPQEPHP